MRYFALNISVPGVAMDKRQLSGSKISVFVAICALSVLALRADAPRGWHLAGSKAAEYETNVDADQSYQGQGSASLKSKGTAVDGFGTLMQSISAEKYKGSKVRLSGLVKSEDVTHWAGLWMRVDKGTEALAFDNMQKRGIRGTTGWQRYYVVLDVPKDATKIAFGILLSGPGSVWLNNPKLEIVSTDEASTNVPEQILPESPVNLQFVP
jgi:hypothetical protein